MSSFTANASPTVLQRPVTAGPFWPEVDVAALRDAIRLPGDVTGPRLRGAVVMAVMAVTRELASWKCGIEAQGHLTLDDAPAPQVDGASALVHLFLRAVHCATAVELHERYRSYDATAQGTQRADELTPTIDEIRRDHRNAIRDLIGTGRLTVELI